MFSEYLEHHREELQKKLLSAKDVKETHERLRTFLAAMQSECAINLTSARKREACSALFDVAQSALACLPAASKADILFREIPSSQSEKKAWWHYLGVVASLGLATHSFFLSSWNALAVCLGLSLWQIVVIQRVRLDASATPPEALATVRVDDSGLLMTLSRWAAVMDRAFDGLCANAPVLDSGSLTWSPRALEILQKLWRTKATNDGAAALDLIGELLKRLEDEELDICEYDRELDSSFDKMPGQHDGTTILPVIKKHDRVLARGMVIRTQA